MHRASPPIRPMRAYGRGSSRGRAPWTARLRGLRSESRGGTPWSQGGRYGGSLGLLVLPNENLGRVWRWRNGLHKQRRTRSSVEAPPNVRNGLTRALLRLVRSEEHTS